ncbi:hypothetical protein D3C87_1539670 [compost metagenome]
MPASAGSSVAIRPISISAKYSAGLISCCCSSRLRKTISLKPRMFSSTLSRQRLAPWNEAPAQPRPIQLPSNLLAIGNSSRAVSCSQPRLSIALCTLICTMPKVRISGMAMYVCKRLIQIAGSGNTNGAFSAAMIST